MARLEIEHIVPLAKDGGNDEDNLWLCCPICNRYKGDLTLARDRETGQMVPLFHPRNQRWFEHFAWSSDGLRVKGLTPVGRATVAALHLDNDPDAIVVRGYWVMAGWHPPQD